MPASSAGSTRNCSIRTSVAPVRTQAETAYVEGNARLRSIRSSLALASVARRPGVTRAMGALLRYPHNRAIDNPALALPDSGKSDSQFLGMTYVVLRLKESHGRLLNSTRLVMGAGGARRMW